MTGEPPRGVRGPIAVLGLLLLAALVIAGTLAVSLHTGRP